MGAIEWRCIELRGRPPFEIALIALLAFRAVVSGEPRLQLAVRMASPLFTQ